MNQEIHSRDSHCLVSEQRKAGLPHQSSAYLQISHPLGMNGEVFYSRGKRT